MTSEIERINVIVLVLGSIASLMIMREFKYFFSFAVGSAMMTLNFRLLRRIVTRIFEGGVLHKRELVKLPLKFLALAGLVAIIVLLGNVDALFFLAGLSTVFFSIVIQQIGTLFASDKRRDEHGA